MQDLLLFAKHQGHKEGVESPSLDRLAGEWMRVLGGSLPGKHARVVGLKRGDVTKLLPSAGYAGGECVLAMVTGNRAI